MEAIEKYLLQVYYFFLNNWVAAAVLGVAVIIFALKKPKELFKVVTLIILVIAVLYSMVFLEKSLFSGVSNREQAVDIERKGK